MPLTPVQVRGKKCKAYHHFTSISHCVGTKNKAIYISRVKKSLSEGALRPSDLLAQFKQTEARTRTQIRAAELLDNTVELIREMVYTNTMVQPSPHGTEQQHNITQHIEMFLLLYVRSFFQLIPTI